MNVIQRPREKEFCGSMLDYIIDTDSTILFSIEYGGKMILEEEYVPNGNYQVRVRNLGKFCELALWGVWCAGETSWQTDAAGTFTFLINGVQDIQSFVMFSRLQTRKDASEPGWLSEVNQKVTHPDSIEYLSFLMKTDDIVKVTAYSPDETGVEHKLFQCTAEGSSPVTFDVSPLRITTLFPSKDIHRYKVECNGYEFMYHIDRTCYAEMWCFRYKNVYDMPETLTITGGLKLVGNNDGSTAAMFGIERKFSVKVTDEYTASSGIIMLQSDYKLWHNLLNAQEVDLFIDDQWLPIIITKQKFEREFRRSALKTVEFSFRLADPEQNNLIEL